MEDNYLTILWWFLPYIKSATGMLLFILTVDYLNCLGWGKSLVYNFDFCLTFVLKMEKWKGDCAISLLLNRPMSRNPGITAVWGWIIVFFFNWNIVYLQCCTNLWYTAKWLSYTYMCLLLLYSFPMWFNHRFNYFIEYSSLCYTLGPCFLCILNSVVCSAVRSVLCTGMFSCIPPRCQ